MPDFHNGEIVYFLHQTAPACYAILFGIVDEEFSDKVSVEVLELMECRRVNGIPIDEFDDPTPHKLPRGWSWNTKLFELTEDPLPDGADRIDITDPASLLDAYRRGWLVKAECIDPCSITTVITKDGYRVVRSYGIRMELYDRHLTRVSLERKDVFRTWNDAIARRAAILSELARQSALSDDEWSMEQIEKTLLRYRLTFGVPDEIIEKCRAFLSSLPDLFDVVTRVTSKGLEWKYDKKKKWNQLDPIP